MGGGGAWGLRGSKAALTAGTLVASSRSLFDSCGLLITLAKQTWSCN